LGAVRRNSDRVSGFVTGTYDLAHEFKVVKTANLPVARVTIGPNANANDIAVIR